MSFSILPTDVPGHPCLLSLELHKNSNSFLKRPLYRTSYSSLNGPLRQGPTPLLYVTMEVKNTTPCQQNGTSYQSSGLSMWCTFRVRHSWFGNHHNSITCFVWGACRGRILGRLGREKKDVLVNINETEYRLSLWHERRKEGFREVKQRQEVYHEGQPGQDVHSSIASSFVLQWDPTE